MSNGSMRYQICPCLTFSLFSSFRVLRADCDLYTQNGKSRKIQPYRDRRTAELTKMRPSGGTDELIVSFLVEFLFRICWAVFIPAFKQTLLCPRQCGLFWQASPKTRWQNESCGWHEGRLHTGSATCACHILSMFCAPFVCLDVSPPTLVLHAPPLGHFSHLSAPRNPPFVLPLRMIVCSPRADTPTQGKMDSRFKEAMLLKKRRQLLREATDRYVISRCRNNN